MEEGDSKWKPLTQTRILEKEMHLCTKPNRQNHNEKSAKMLVIPNKQTES